MVVERRDVGAEARLSLSVGEPLSELFDRASRFEPTRNGHTEERERERQIGKRTSGGKRVLFELLVTCDKCLPPCMLATTTAIPPPATTLPSILFKSAISEMQL